MSPSGMVHAALLKRKILYLSHDRLINYAALVINGNPGEDDPSVLTNVVDLVCWNPDIR